MTGYIVSNLLWSAVGFLVGVFVGRIGREAAKGDALTRRVGLDVDRVITLIFVLLAAVTVVMGASTTIKQQHIVDCQARYNQQFRDGLEERGQASDTDREAMRRLVESITQAQSREQVAEAMSRFLAASKNADQQRADNPLPTNDDCDKSFGLPPKGR